MPRDPGVVGVWYNDSWFCLPWMENSISLHITVKEMAPIIIAAIIWSHACMEGALVTTFCDNTAVVAAVNNRCCKEKHVMHSAKGTVLYRGPPSI